jgi:acyl-CoA synthetase (AMP-forming)/AMP-acid ligase II
MCSRTHIQIEKELPKNAAGEILKRELKEKYQEIFNS